MMFTFRDGLDVAAHAEGCVVNVLGLDDHPTMAPQIREWALSLGAIESESES